MASCGFAHLSGDRLDQVQTIRQMSSMWLWEAVQGVYSRPPSKFSVCEDSTLDCESKLLLARLVREYISLLLPYHLYCKPSTNRF